MIKRYINNDEKFLDYCIKYSKFKKHIIYGIEYVGFANTILLIGRFLAKGNVIISFTHILTVSVWLILILVYTTLIIYERFEKIRTL